MKIACRWPGGMDIARPGAPKQVVHLNGPPGFPSLLPPALSRGAPSRNAATLVQKAVADTVKRMIDTAGGDYADHEYGVTDIPGDFWNAWFAHNADNDVITKDMVFALE